MEMWHSLDMADVFEKVGTIPEGLTQEEAARRLVEHGPNRLPAPRRRGAAVRFLLQFHNVLIYVLLGAALITALLADWIDAGVILGVVFINGVIGFLQEGKAERAVDAIRGILTHETVVLREGKKVTISGEELVPGDVVLLQSGDKVPADLRLFMVKDLRIEEAALTGESVPVDKKAAPVAGKTALGDRHCMAFSGTIVTYGQGRGVVVATGEKTELGKVSAMLSGVDVLQTRLTRQMGEFSQWLTGAILVLAAGTLAFGILIRSYSSTEIFFASVALAVAAIPEGLPAIITIALAIGVQRMAKRHAIIRRLPAVETLGSVTVICSDKTGTLTRNEMTVTGIVTAAAAYQVEGAGYEPAGRFLKDAEHVDPLGEKPLGDLVRAVCLCNDGELVETGGLWKVVGDPTEGAMLALGMKAGIDVRALRQASARLDGIPFESEHKYMATLHQEDGDGGIIYLKGAPERVLEMCDLQRGREQDFPVDRAFWQEQMERIAGSGQRPLAAACKPAGDRKEIHHGDVAGGLILLGFLGLSDPPREEAVHAVKQCANAGIRVKMITGDHALTAAAVGEKIGLSASGGVVTGSQIDHLDDERLRLQAAGADIFARVSPEHKLRLVKALQADGQIVAMTGDGVNDAPALKRADVGIAMGLKGTEAAKESAEMVLADDNFASIVHAVEEGRTVYDNIRKTLAFLLPTNGAQAGIIMASVIAGVELPITPLQILWINMVTAVTLGLSLAFEPPECDVMRRRPRDPNAPLLTQFLVWRILFISLIMVFGTVGLFLWDRFHGETLQVSRTMAVNTLIFFQIFYLLSARTLQASVVSWRGLLANPFVPAAMGMIVVIQLAFTYAPTMQHLFGTASLPVLDWVRLVSFTVFVFVLVEAEKKIMQRLERRKRIWEELH